MSKPDLSSVPGMTFITTLTKPRETKPGMHRDCRCVGFLSDKMEAIALVENNAGDIHEDGLYPLCVVETLSEGIYPIPLATAWFEWDPRKKGYARIEQAPEDLQGICNFSLG